MHGTTCCFRGQVKGVGYRRRHYLAVNVQEETVRRSHKFLAFPLCQLLAMCDDYDGGLWHCVPPSQPQNHKSRKKKRHKKERKGVQVQGSLL